MGWCAMQKLTYFPLIKKLSNFLYNNIIYIINIWYNIENRPVYIYI